jgi:Uma2 family endonuclease
MSQTIVRPQAPTKLRDNGIRRRLWTREEYYRAAKVGLFRPNERLELLDGEILQKMTQRPPHTTAVSVTAVALTTAFGPNHYARQQQPIILNDLSEPEPDVLIVPGTPQDYRETHPTAADAILLVEVADATLRLDRGGKLAAYARAGVQEYWILNLRDRRLEVHRDPAGESHRTTLTYGEGDLVVPLAAPQARIPISDLLPVLRTRKRR